MMLDNKILDDEDVAGGVEVDDFHLTHEATTGAGTAEMMVHPPRPKHEEAESRRRRRRRTFGEFAKNSRLEPDCGFISEPSASESTMERHHHQYQYHPQQQHQQQHSVAVRRTSKTQYHGSPGATSLSSVPDESLSSSQPRQRVVLQFVMPETKYNQNTTNMTGGSHGPVTGDTGSLANFSLTSSSSCQAILHHPNSSTIISNYNPALSQQQQQPQPQNIHQSRSYSHHENYHQLRLNRSSSVDSMTLSDEDDDDDDADDHVNKNDRHHHPTYYETWIRQAANAAVGEQQQHQQPRPSVMRQSSLRSLKSVKEDRPLLSQEDDRPLYGNNNNNNTIHNDKRLESSTNNHFHQLCSLEQDVVTTKDNHQHHIHFSSSLDNTTNAERFYENSNLRQQQHTVGGPHHHHHKAETTTPSKSIVSPDNDTTLLLAGVPTYQCPRCGTRQREFFTSTNVAGRLEGPASYLALYFSIYVICSLFIFGLEEGWMPLDCIYFAVITLTTAGLGDYVPTSTANKLICSIFIYFGVACIGLLLGSYIASMLDSKASEDRIATKDGSVRTMCSHTNPSRSRGGQETTPTIKTHTGPKVV